jgi:ABC-type sugar transport system substrate-binding protein
LTAREGLRLVGALLLGAALALPAGMMLARRDAPERAPARASQAAAVRKVFSPSVRDDPYFLGKQREGVEALEAYCRRSGEMCAEAKQARARLAELTGE